MWRWTSLIVVIIGLLIGWQYWQRDEAERGGNDVTDTTKHSIPLEENVDGGPPRDGIPSIDDPEFVAISEASGQLADDKPGIAIELGGVARFYPYEILVWHEIVNDTLPDGQRILVTYCPLCRSGIVFDPLVDGERVEFGTSGKLWNSNLLLYDRTTESLWSQVLGEAVVGPQTGTKLTILPSDISSFGAWQQAHPAGQVLARPANSNRTYGRDPYGDYATTTGTYFPLSNRDDRLGEKALVYGVEFDGQTKAYPDDLIRRVGTVHDTFNGREITAQYDAGADTVRLFVNTDGGRERLNPFVTYWFAWAAAHPETALYEEAR
ncbi:DUF3179 domain-containing protein [Candidatus Berkelbacteria bacterium]|nr:DUF3179 domain-containing protein [Candidatus Berkelbacteria bacterium]